MKKVLFIVILWFNVIPMVFAKTATIQNLAQTCSTCHGSHGQGVNPQWPKLAGQNRRYFIEQMQAFKSKSHAGRHNAVMANIAAKLSNAQIKALACYYAQSKPASGRADAKFVNQGQRIYLGGDIQNGIPACAACHGPKGIGNAQAGFPRLSGQYADYVIKQLQAYRNGTRINAINDMMSSAAKALTNQQIKAVAEYIAGLH